MHFFSPLLFFFFKYTFHFGGREGQLEVRGNITGGSLKVSNQSHPGRLPEGVSHQESVGLQLVLLKKQASLYQAPRAVREAGFSVPGLVCSCATTNTSVRFDQSQSRCV